MPYAWSVFMEALETNDDIWLFAMPILRRYSHHVLQKNDCMNTTLLAHTVVGVATMPAVILLFGVSLALFDNGRNAPGKKKHNRGILSKKKRYETTRTKRLEAKKLLHFSLVVQ